MQPPIFALLHELFPADGVFPLILGGALVLWLPGVVVVMVLAKLYDEAGGRGLRSPHALGVVAVLLGVTLVWDPDVGVLALALGAGLYAADAFIRGNPPPTVASSSSSARWAELLGTAPVAGRLPFAETALGAAAFAITAVVAYLLAFGLVGWR